jgi:hypothetical protein
MRTCSLGEYINASSTSAGSRPVRSFSCTRSFTSGSERLGGALARGGEASRRRRDREGSDVVAEDLDEHVDALGVEGGPGFLAE